MNTTEVSSNLFYAAEEGVVLKPFANKVVFEEYRDDYDGIFPRVGDWTRFANAIDREGISKFLNFHVPKHKRLNIDYDYCFVVRESDYDYKAKIVFKQPILMDVGQYGTTHIVKVKELTGEFTYEWYWCSNGRQDKIANEICVYFEIESIETVKTPELL